MNFLFKQQCQLDSHNHNRDVCCRITIMIIIMAGAMAIAMAMAIGMVEKYDHEWDTDHYIIIDCDRCPTHDHSFQPCQYP